jgi:hypothetical protein
MSKVEQYLSGTLKVKSRTTFIRYAQSQNILKPNDLKIFGSKFTKGHKHYSQTRLRSRMPEGGVPEF